MTLEHHDLATEFPEFKDQIHTLKEQDAHFSRRFEEYQDVDKEIIRAEQEIETLSDEHLEELKKKRLVLKDELLSMLRKAA